MLKRLALAAAILAAPVAAEAQSQPPVTLARVGGWEAFIARGETSGRVICGMMATWADGRTLMVKWFEGSDRITVQATNPAWRIPAGQRVPIMLQVQGFSPWTATANGQGDMVEWVFSQRNDAIGRFENEFRYGSRMTLAFPQGSAAPWNISLLGSNAVVGPFSQCIRQVGARRGGSPAPADGQPFSPGQPL